MKNANRILIEFIREESKIGLKEIPCLDLAEQVLIINNRNEVLANDLF